VIAPRPGNVKLSWPILRNVRLRVSLTLALIFMLPILFFAREEISASASDQFYLQLPVGIPADVWSYFIPKQNPLTPAKIELGRRLFFDKRLSADSSVSCASCHDPKFAFTDGRKTAVGIDGRNGARNTPTVLNAMFNSSLFWDGRADSLEAQALEPLVNRDEMGNSSPEDVVKRIAVVSEYVEQFQKVFGGPVTIDSLTKAIAAYERTLVSGDAPFDRFLAGDRSALSDSAQRGLNLFRGKARCSVCHTLNASFPFLTDGNYRNTGVAANFAGFDSLSRRARLVLRDRSTPTMKLFATAQDTELDQQGKSALGRFVISEDALDVGAFRTPSLRNVELTAPYFHDGSVATLADVVRYYVRGGNETASRDWELQAVDLSESEQKDLIEFLKSLTSDTAKQAQRNSP
jgi:cytochrome c peroxidase